MTAQSLAMPAMNSRWRKTMQWVTALLLVCLMAAPANAWNWTGHKIIASIAFRQLTAAEQAKLVGMLRRHPRFTQDFSEQMLDDIRRAADTEQNEWLLQQAAVWPDTVRSGPPEKQAFSRPEWHYINLPVFLTDEARLALADQLSPNISLNPPSDATLDTARMNVVQMIRFARRQIVDKQTAPETKAVLLAWLLHDVGDLHQPLHSSALYSKQLFPEGDRGGNSIKVREQGNLHSLWDNFPGRDDTTNGPRNKAIEYIHDSELSRLGQKAAQNLREHEWLLESHALAKEMAYSSEVIAALRSMEATTGQIAEIDLSEAYLKAGGRASQRRLVEAGYRLGAVLKEIAAE